MKWFHCLTPHIPSKIFDTEGLFASRGGTVVDDGSHNTTLGLDPCIVAGEGGRKEKGE